MTDVHRTVQAVWKLESSRMVAGLMRLVHDLGKAEELAQDALVAALEQWERDGIPDNPGAWLTTVAKRRAVDHIRRARRLGDTYRDLADHLEPPVGEPSAADGGVEAGGGDEADDVLRLIFISCHPLLSPEARIALTLRVVAGLTPAEIGRAYLVPETTIVERLSNAKRALGAASVRFELPDPDELTERLSSVLAVIYLIFNEGYSATAGNDLMRPELTLEALRIGRLLAEVAPEEAEVHGLVALMEIQASRTAARVGPAGEPIQLHEQNRGLWDQLLIRRGFSAMLRARDLGGPAGPYVLQGAIAVCHAQARTAADTDWARIAALYDTLVRQLPTPVVQLNRAVATGMAHGPDAGLELVERLLSDPILQDYHLLHGVHGDLLARAGRPAAARPAFERAASRARNDAEATFLRRRADELAPAAPRASTLGGVADLFLERDDLEPATTRSYAQTLGRLRRMLGDRLPLASLGADEVAAAAEAAWAGTAPATWNRHVAAIRSFAAWAGVDHLAGGLDRRTRTVAEPRPVPDLSRLWTLEDIPLRERTLWLLLHESSVGASTALALDVEDLDLDDRRARVGRTSVTWRSGTARLLPDLLAGRSRGPVFLANRRPVPSRALAETDRCPVTGRRRLSYERAEHLFKQATRTIDPQGRGYTLGCLRETRAGGGTRPSAGGSRRAG